MKNITNYIRPLILSGLFFLTFGCKKTLDVNVDPNNPAIEAASPEVLFPSAVMSTAGRVGGDMAILGGIWSQYWTQSFASNQYKTIDTYNLTRTDFNGGSDQLFAGALADYQLAIKKAQDASDWRYNLMATVMKAYTYQVLVDLYDQLPYTEAFQGSANLQPKYDDGYFIYQSLLTEINTALTKDFTSIPLTGSQAKGDFLFAGDMARWVQFANTLKLKMYLRMVNAKPAEAEAGIRALYTDGANFLSVGAGIAKFEDSPNNSNPMYESNVRRLNTTTNLRASYTFSSWLIENEDPRATKYFGTASPIGQNQGDFAATQQEQPTYANASVAAQKATDPVWFISDSESFFMQAEALERYFAGVGAEALYNQGIEASFTASGSSSDGFVGTGELYAYPTAGSFETKLEAIITQKWASLPGSHALEAFFEQQRTGYPVTSPVYSTADSYIPGQWVYAKNGVTGGGRFPKRLVWPASSRDRNINVPTEVPIYVKVWWGK
ncbi:SusD/RagB family nutrient-binding outer membrane lipoprotein [Pedobacter gandavensis]|uniref:SusD/RagB family nutrient-binding outer membrane lipoprotein n=1 Tax=Pedobacter gandavensis TaxID=2679963 RepID=UPI00292CEAE6|nr:SusD/RagB family nutrient-binding outer membrane lipoprotein [Pedobacter gandavensis]